MALYWNNIINIKKSKLNYLLKLYYPIFQKVYLKKMFGI